MIVNGKKRRQVIEKIGGASRDRTSWLGLPAGGATHASGVNNLNFTRFSFGIGGGIRFYLTRHLGFKIQAEWLPVVMDPQVAFVCGTGCVVNVRAPLSSQGEVTIGPVLHF